jgi:hypothetical protein
MTTQHQLDRAVANATGETIADVQRLGFSIAAPLTVNHDPEPLETEIGKYLDWDVVVAEREALAPC